MNSTRPRLAISMGDPAGIGPELCCRVANDPQLQALCDMEVFAAKGILQRVAEHLALPLPPHIHDCTPPTCDPATISPGTISPESGALAMSALNEATNVCLNGRCAALVTAPIHKAAMTSAGFAHPGHTEYLAARCGVDHATMALHGSSLTVVLATVHCALAQVPALLQSAAIQRCGHELHRALAPHLARPPRLACLGLNPHAGEAGLFGNEEQRLIIPAITQLRQDGLDISGPLAPDTAFSPANRHHYDGFICMYHDQGLIPFKMLHFSDGVNWTLGLPLIRTSPDHGTAFDIAWQGKADPTSLAAAVAWAAQLAREKSPTAVTVSRLAPNTRE